MSHKLIGLFRTSRCEIAGEIDCQVCKSIQLSRASPRTLSMDSASDPLGTSLSCPIMPQRQFLDPPCDDKRVSAFIHVGACERTVTLGTASQTRHKLSFKTYPHYRASATGVFLCGPPTCCTMHCALSARCLSLWRRHNELYSTVYCSLSIM